MPTFYADRSFAKQANPKRSLSLAACLALAACGFSGTDGNKNQSAAASGTSAGGPGAPPAGAAAGPDFARLAPSDIPDAVQRPIMQAQVVLDAQGFGPGIIDGKMGLSTVNGIKGFQEAHGLQVTGKLDEPTQMALAQWKNVPATRVIRIPDSWGQIEYVQIPKDEDAKAKLKHLGYQSIDEKLAERFHTTPALLQELNPNGQPASLDAGTASGTPSPAPTGSPSPTPSPSASSTGGMVQAVFHPGQTVRVPNVGLDGDPSPPGDDKDWSATLASLGISAQQPHVDKVVVSKAGGWLKGYDASGKLVAMFTVTTGSQHDPLPLGDWKIVGVDKNPPFHYNPNLFWDAKPTDKQALLPPGPNGPVGVVWIDLSKEHYGIHGTPEPQTIGRTESHGCVRLTNWDAARLAGMVSTSTKVTFEA